MQHSLRSPFFTRMVLVAGIYSVVMIVVLAGETLSRHSTAPARRRWKLFGSLAASGALAAAGGVLWLIDHNRAPVPTRIIGDLRIPAAAILAGSAVLTGHGRGLLVCICLPLSLLLASIWRKEVLPIGGLQEYAVATQMLVMMVMILTVHAGFRRGRTCRGRRQLVFFLCLAGAILGLALVACQANWQSYCAKRMFHLPGVILFLVSAAAMLVVYLQSKRRRA